MYNIAGLLTQLVECSAFNRSVLGSSPRYPIVNLYVARKKTRFSMLKRRVYLPLSPLLFFPLVTLQGSVTNPTWVEVDGRPTPDGAISTITPRTFGEASTTTTNR